MCRYVCISVRCDCECAATACCVLRVRVHSEEINSPVRRGHSHVALDLVAPVVRHQ